MRVRVFEWRAAIHAHPVFVILAQEGRREEVMAVFLYSPFNIWFLGGLCRLVLYGVAVSGMQGSAVLNERGYILELVDAADKRSAWPGCGATLVLT